MKGTPEKIREKAIAAATDLLKSKREPGRGDNPALVLAGICALAFPQLDVRWEVVGLVADYCEAMADKD